MTFDRSKSIDLEDSISERIDNDNEPLRFGKYKGETPNEIARINPSYIVWFYESVEGASGMISETLYENCLER